jgi:nitrite reductase (NADH) small subunit
MAFVKVASLAQLPPDSVMEVIVDGNPIAVCRRGDQVHALLGVCAHQGGPIGQGALNGDFVACPWHGWEFHCATGENDFDPETKLPTYPVRIEGDDILVDLSA